MKFYKPKQASLAINDFRHVNERFLCVETIKKRKERGDFVPRPWNTLFHPLGTHCFNRVEQCVPNGWNKTGLE